MKECNCHHKFTLYTIRINIVERFSKRNAGCRYGELQGLNKQETAERYGKEQVHKWRRSYDIPPPNGESLEMCAERAVAYFKDQV